MDAFRFLTDTETLNFLIDNSCGLCRFGNSELSYIAGRDVRHQRQVTRLRKLLIEVITDYNQAGPEALGMLLCLPLDMTVERDYFNRSAFSAAQGHYRADIWRRSPLQVIRKMAKQGTLYGASHAFRLKDCVPEGTLMNHAAGFLGLLRSRPSIYVGPWADKKIVSELLPNTDFVGIPATDAFNEFDRLLERIRVLHASKPGSHVLITAGLTGTVLSYELNKGGIKALDIGQSVRHLGATI